MLINDSRVKRDKTFTTTFKHVKPIAYTRSNYVRTKLIVVDSRQIRLCRNFLKGWRLFLMSKAMDNLISSPLILLSSLY